jgi:hypothetical protein
MSWLKWHIGCVSDDKWPLIARRSGQNVGTVVAVWAALLECASEADEPGSIAEFDPDSIDALYGYEDGTCESIITALKDGKNPRIVDNMIIKFDERQKRQDETNAERQRRYRERHKDNKINDATDSNAKVTADSVTSNGENVTVTESNAKVTGLDKNREEKNLDLNSKAIIYNKTNLNSQLCASQPPSAVSDAPRIDKNSFPTEQKDEEKPAEQHQPANEPHHGDKKATKKRPPSSIPDGPSYLTAKKRYLTGKRLESFERFWTAFGYRKGKAQAADAWMDIPELTNALVQQIIAAAGREAAARTDIVAAGRTPIYPQGWISGRRWEDEAGDGAGARRMTLDELMRERGMMQ